MLGLLLLACSVAQSPEVEISSTGVNVTHDEGVSHVTLRDISGRLILEQPYPVPLAAVQVDYIWTETGEYELSVRGPSGEWTLPLPVSLNPYGFEIYGGVAGQNQTRFTNETEVPIAIVGDVGLQWLLRVQSWKSGRLSLQNEDDEQFHDVEAGESTLAWYQVEPEKQQNIEICLEKRCQTLTLNPVRIGISEARQQLSIESWVLPSDLTGEADSVLPAEQLWLPARWWQQILSSAGLGFRARDPWSPIAFEAVGLHNHTETAISVLIDSRVVNEVGEPEPLFKPRIREGASPDGRRRALLSVPANKTAHAILPVYFDSLQFQADQGQWERELRVSALGHGAPLHEEKKQIVVQRAHGWVTIGFTIAILAGLGGIGFTFIKGRQWLRYSSSILTTVAMFAALESVTRLVVRVAGLSAAAILGPFSIFLTALPDQLVRFSILGALIGLLPRTGVAGMMVGVGWLLSGVLSGSLSLIGFLTVMGEILWLESALWVCGVTRRSEGAVNAPARFFTAILTFSVLSSACGYALHMVLYRLFYHPMYLGAVLLGPGCLYVALAALVARQLMHSLSKVQR